MASRIRYSTILLSITLLARFICNPTCAEAQIARSFGAGALVLDDGSGNSITLVTPPGLGGSYTYYLPPPPGGSITSGFVEMGSSSGQTLYWNGSYWTPSSYLFNTGAGLSILGSLSANGSTGSTGQVLTINGAGNPIWSNVAGTGTVTSVDVSGGTTGLSTSGGPIASAGTITLAGTLVETNGGTNQNTYAKGDILFASNTNTLSRLAIGNANNQVLTVSNGVPVWATGGGGGMSNPMTTLGDMIYEDATLNPNRVAGITSTTRNFLSQTGNGTISAAPVWTPLASADIPNNAANTTGTASNVTGTVLIAKGGTGQTTQQSAMDALAGSQASGKYLRSDGSHTTLSAISAGDVPTLNQSTTGTASNVTGTVAIANGGTGQTTQQAAMDALAGTQSSGKYLRSDGSHTTLSAISAGDVPTLNQNTTGTASNVTGTVAIVNGGTGQTTQQAAMDALAGLQSSGKYLRSDGSHTTLSAISAGDVPTLNQNTTGAASNVTGTVAIANGGTGQTTQQAAMDALAGTQSSGKYLRSDGSHTTLSAISAGDVPTLNQNTTGTASNVTGTVAIANGGTGQTTANAALNALLPTQTSNSGKVLESDGTNTSWQAVSGTGTVTSVAVSGGTTGLTTSGGPITGAGTITFAGDLAVANGGTGATTASGARTALGAAASGANSDITSLSALSTPLPVSEGGSGVALTTANSVFAGPVSGGSAAPGFRGLVSDDIPGGSGNYIQNGTSLQSSANFDIDGSGSLGGSFLVSGTTASTPASGPGRRMMWSPVRGAFRAGEAAGTEWDDANIGNYSNAIGYGTTASGDYSTAIGFDAFANVQEATSIGYFTFATAQYALALGNQTTASGSSSTSMGYMTNATNFASTAMGYNTYAEGAYSLAGGNSSTAYGNSTIAYGAGAYAFGDYSVALGNNAQATGLNSTAFGHGTTASGSYSTAMGNSTTAGNPYATAMGYGTNAEGQYSTATGLSTTASDEAFSAGEQSRAIGAHSAAFGYYAYGGGEGAFAAGDYAQAGGNYSAALGFTTHAYGESSIALGNYAWDASYDHCFNFSDGTAIPSSNDAANQFMVRASGGYKLFADASASPALTLDNTGLNLANALSVGNGGTGATTLTGIVHGNGASAMTAGPIDLASEISGTLTVPNGGSGASTLTGIVHGNGTSAMTAGNVALGSEVSGTLPVGNGGTGITSYTTADILYASNSGTLSKLGVGAEGDVLTISSGLPKWELPSGGGGSGWGLTGNSGTVYQTNFIGTTDDVDLQFRIDNTQSGIIESDGNRNTGLGYQVFYLNGGGQYNAAFGFQSLSINSGSYNSAFGSNALPINSTGSGNTGMGVGVLFFNDDGDDNTATGSSALAANVHGSNNTASGSSALVSSTSDDNTAVGYTALYTITTGSHNTGIGYDADAAANNLTNATAIGAQAYVGASNSLVLGSISGINGATSNVNVGIGTTTPAMSLDVTGTFRATSNTTLGGNINTQLATGIVHSGGVGTNLTSSAVSLSTDVSGILQMANGGTGISSSGAGGNFLRSNGSAWTSSAIQASDLAQTAILYGYGGGQNTLTSGAIPLFNIGYGATSTDLAGAEINCDATVGGTVTNKNAVGLNVATTANGASKASIALVLDAIGTGGAAGTAIDILSGDISIFNNSTHIYFGSGSDVDLYRSSGGALETDNNFISVGSVTGATFQNASSTFSVTSGGTANVSQNYDIGSAIYLSNGGTEAHNNLLVGNTTASITSGTNNTLIGKEAEASLTTGSDNTAVGYQALKMNATGIQNTAFGSGALTAEGQPGNTGVGYQALHSGNGGENTAVGAGAMGTGSSGGTNTAVGYQAMDANNGDQNTAVGVTALYNNTGGFNIAVGNQALLFNTSGTNNVAVGYSALLFNTTGTESMAAGYSALGSSTGNYNTGAGGEAGKTVSSGTKNSFLGYLADVSTGTLSNATAIGANAEATASNSLVLGSINGTNSASADVNVGIGTTAPSQKLEVKNGSLLLSNSGTAQQLQLQGTSSGISTFQAGAQGSTSINYTLPTSQPNTNDVLTATAVSGSAPYAVTLGWASASGGSSPLFAYKSAYKDYTTTSLVADNDLKVKLAANATYVFEAFLSFTDQSGNSTDGKIGFSVPTGSTIKFGWNTTPGSTAITTTVVNAGNTASQQLYIVNGDNSYETAVHVKGIIFTSSTSDYLNLECERVNGTTLRLQANSYMTATRVQ